MTAMIAETRMKNRMKILITMTFFFSLMTPPLAGSMTSRVKVELDVSTSDDSVDMDADSTSTITIAMISAGSVPSMDGTMVSNSGVAPSLWYAILSAYSLPNPPRK